MDFCQDLLVQCELKHLDTYKHSHSISPTFVGTKYKFIPNDGRVNGSQLAKSKRVFRSCYWHDVNRVEAVGLKFKLYLKNYNVCEYVKFWVICSKIDISPITVGLPFDSENSFAHMLLIIDYLL